jgi:hypothetical protein
VSSVATRIDPVTGSMIRKTVWFGSIVASESVELSPLAERASALGIKLEPRWKGLNTTQYSALGLVAIGCSRAPSIYPLHPMLKEFVSAASDDEIRDFVQIMESGNEQQQRATVNAAIAKSVAWAKSQPSRPCAE